MNANNRFRLPAVLSALAFLLAELISRPFAQMGLIDDWSYIRTVQIFARTGHIEYNAWASPILGWQLFLGAWFTKLFGFSFTPPRMSTLAIATILVFFIQRTLVRAGVSERNATLGTLAITLTPLYMQLSVSFMTDIQGMFAIVLCLYGCLRALQAKAENTAAGWIVFAVAVNAIAGTSRQIAWLGLLVMVPATLWLLRGRRTVLLVGALVNLAGVAFIFWCMHWFGLQPYSQPEHLFIKIHGAKEVGLMIRYMARAVLDVPFVMIALMVVFLPEVRRNSRRFLVFLAVVGVGWTLLAIKVARTNGAGAMLEPLLGDVMGPHAYYEGVGLAGDGPVVLGIGLRILLTIVSLAGMFCVGAFLLRIRRLAVRPATTAAEQPGLSWRRLGLLVGPVTLAYLGLMIPRSASKLMDRYLLVVVFVGTLCLIRAYQQYIQPKLPRAMTIAIAVVALYSIGSTHDMFALYRARAAAADELMAAGVPDNQIDGGFDYDGWVELERSPYIDVDTLVNPPGAFVPLDPKRGWACDSKVDTPTIFRFFDPRFGMAFEPDACKGLAPVAPVTYFRWLVLHPTTLYVVRYGPR